MERRREETYRSRPRIGFCEPLCLSLALGARLEGRRELLYGRSSCVRRQRRCVRDDGV